MAQSSQTVDSERAKLEAELAEVERLIAEQKQLLGSQQAKSASISRDVSILETKIKAAQLSIQQRRLYISKLEKEITGKENLIGQLGEKIDRERASLAEIIRKRDELDRVSLVEVVLGSKQLSDFFIDTDSFDTINSALRASVGEVRKTRQSTESERDDLDEKRQEEAELRRLQELERQRIEEQKGERAKVLAASKTEEKKLKLTIAEKEREASKIRTALFSLRGSSAIPFEQALAFANQAGKLTGVRPALILGIIAEESNLGQNVGTGNWKTDMHPTRDVPVFADITARLGLNPDTMLVSKRPCYKDPNDPSAQCSGWGGAMGPAQFIPSTWVLYEKKISAVTGNTPPNPWDPEDAFTASAILLKENGASAGSAASERLAALRYLAGWGNASKPAYAFYGDDVMELAAKYQITIDRLKQLES
jgi:membrane-bound lytic murein transglycosylase B